MEGTAAELEGTAAESCETSAQPFGRADVHVELLGHVAIRSATGVSQVTGRPATVLVELVLAEGPVPVTRLVDLLWSVPPVHELNALQRHVSRLRQTFRERGADDVVRHRGGFYYLDRTMVTVDVEQLEAGKADAPYESRWWMDPLPAFDHVDFIGYRQQIRQRYHSASARASITRSTRRATAWSEIRGVAHECGCSLGGRGVGCDVPPEVSRQLGRWLEIRAAHDQEANLIRQWLDSLECGAHDREPVSLRTG